MTLHPGAGGFGPDRYDLDEHRAKVFDALSRHSDPIMREMGKQLASGTVTPHELLDETRYVEVLRRGLDQVADLDDAELRARLFGRPGSNGPDTGEGNVPAGRR